MMTQRELDELEYLHDFTMWIYGIYNCLIIKPKRVIVQMLNIAGRLFDRAEELRLCLIYGKRTTRLGTVVPNVEYYLIDGGIKVRRFQGIAGAWKMINGREVRCERRARISIKQMTENAIEITEKEADIKREKRILMQSEENSEYARRGPMFGAYGGLPSREWFHRGEKERPWHKQSKEMGLSV